MKSTLCTIAYKFYLQVVRCIFSIYLQYVVVGLPANAKHRRTWKSRSRTKIDTSYIIVDRDHVDAANN